MRWGHRLGNVQLSDQLVITCPYTGTPRAVQASDEAASYGVDRRMQDEWALRSQQRGSAASSLGYCDEEIVPVPQGYGAPPLEHDECSSAWDHGRRVGSVGRGQWQPDGNGWQCPRHGNRFDSARVDNSSRSSEEGSTPARAGFGGRGAISGWSFHRIASVPAVAAQKALAAADLPLGDISLIEINEAFAAVPLVTTEVLSEGDPAFRERLRDITNVNGGAIAVGHPTGATAARMLMTLVHELRRRGGGFGLATLCGGIGEAQAAIVEVSCP